LWIIINVDYYSPACLIIASPNVIGSTILHSQPIEVVSFVEDMLPQYRKHFEEEKEFYFKKID